MLQTNIDSAQVNEGSLSKVEFIRCYVFPKCSPMFLGASWIILYVPICLSRRCRNVSESHRNKLRMNRAVHTRMISLKRKSEVVSSCLGSLAVDLQHLGLQMRMMCVLHQGSEKENHCADPRTRYFRIVTGFPHVFFVFVGFNSFCNFSIRFSNRLVMCFVSSNKPSLPTLRNVPETTPFKRKLPN